ncbi:hypothetical protein NliqN6_3453 [Naganishia liquefaciens]|uniref:Phosphoglycerate mutase-like protein n=1 Tax=Naganishia liquefaciens TaxID=104408 RepID=A0A8H3TU95_9TREE|nr:hypothetical protein NliqN6_3453 [Naganishia liquefaciens]
MSSVIGVVIIARHGDREGYYQSPTSYAASDTTITPLGSVQTYRSGQGARARYLGNGTERIAGLQQSGIDLNQVDFKADAAEGQVILDSTYSFAQGMFPADLEQGTMMLGNGTSVTSPLGGYVYVPIESVESDEDISLEGWTSCKTFTKWTSSVYASEPFKTVAAANADFLTSLKPFVGERNVSLENMYNVFDYMNVNYIHDATFRASVTEQQMEQARALANYHEQAVFSSPQKDGIGNIAGQTMIPGILEAMEKIISPTEPFLLQYYGTAYKPFISLMNITEVGIDGFVNYAAVAAFEVRNSSGTLTVSFNLRNTSEAAPDGSDYQAYPMFGSSTPEMPYYTFVENIGAYGVNSLGEWCNKCETTDARGCDVINALNDTLNDFVSPARTTGRHRVSPLVAGVIGALVGIVAALVVMFLGGAALKKTYRRKVVDASPRRRSEEAESAYEMESADRKTKHAEI